MNTKSTIKPKILGIIIARGGSKGLPGKHLMDLGGKPVLAYSIAAASASKNLRRASLAFLDFPLGGSKDR